VAATTEAKEGGGVEGRRQREQEVDQLLVDIAGVRQELRRPGLGEEAGKPDIALPRHHPGRHAIEDAAQSRRWRAEHSREHDAARRRQDRCGERRRHGALHVRQREGDEVHARLVEREEVRGEARVAGDEGRKVVPHPGEGRHQVARRREARGGREIAVGCGHRLHVALVSTGRY